MKQVKTKMGVIVCFFATFFGTFGGHMGSAITRRPSILRTTTASPAVPFTMTYKFINQPGTSGDSGQISILNMFDYPNFVVRVRTLVQTARPPESVRWRLYRAKTRETYYLTGHLVGRSRSVEPDEQDSSQTVTDKSEGYLYEAAWTVTRRLGEWRISVVACNWPGRKTSEVQSHSQPLVFKINKREQIVTLARYWSSQKLSDCRQLPAFNGCDGFVDYIYQHLGLPEINLGGPTASMVTDNGPGAIRHFFEYGNNTFLMGSSHLALVSEPDRMIDNNWGNSGIGPQEHSDLDGIETFYCQAPVNCSPKDPSNRGQSLLDTL